MLTTLLVRCKYLLSSSSFSKFFLHHCYIPVRSSTWSAFHGLLGPRFNKSIRAGEVQGQDCLQGDLDNNPWECDGLFHSGHPGHWQKMLCISFWKTFLKCLGSFVRWGVNCKPALKGFWAQSSKGCHEQKQGVGCKLVGQNASFIF